MADCYSSSYSFSDIQLVCYLLQRIFEAASSVYFKFLAGVDGQLGVDSRPVCNIWPGVDGRLESLERWVTSLGELVLGDHLGLLVLAVAACHGSSALCTRS
jgi:hypothetical protein